MIALVVPFYSYIQESLENLKNQEIIRMKKEALNIKLDICITSDIKNIITNNKQYKIAFIGEEGNIIDSNIQYNDIVNLAFDELIKDDIIYIQTYLTKGKTEASRFIIAKAIDYSPIIKKVILLAMYILIFLILSSGALIYFSTKTLSQTNKYLAQFFNDAMHEIRTPLGIIQLNLDMLSNTIQESNLPLLNRTQAATKSLSSIYEDVEYFIKYKKVDFQKENINLSLFLKDRVKFFDVLAKIKNIKIITDIEDDIFYSFNRIECQRIIDNNISNAIKYSKENTNITISLKKEKENINLIFKDEGIGIQDTSKIFIRYYRGDEIKGGFGIGLSIVQKICEKYNIDTNIDSEVGTGSTFTYILKNS